MARLLLISGSVRKGSTNQATLNTVAAIAAVGPVGAPEINTVMFEGLGSLPHFNPDDDHDPLPPAVADLRREIDAADGLLFCVPEYAGALPGSLKNLLDWTVGGVETSGKPAGWINVSTAGTGAAGAHAELATVLRYTDALLVEGACVHLPVARNQLGPDGLIEDVDLRMSMREVLIAMCEHCT